MDSLAQSHNRVDTGNGGLRPGKVVSNMATVINTPHAQTDTSSSVGTVLGAIIAILLVAALVFLAIPYFRATTQTPAQNPAINVNATIPMPDTSGGANTNPNTNSDTPANVTP